MSKHKRLKRKVAELEHQLDRMFNLVSHLAGHAQRVNEALAHMPGKIGRSVAGHLLSQQAAAEREQASHAGHFINH